MRVFWAIVRLIGFYAGSYPAFHIFFHLPPRLATSLKPTHKTPGAQCGSFDSSLLGGPWRTQPYERETPVTARVRPRLGNLFAIVPSVNVSLLYYSGGHEFFFQFE